jgi:hypothetical protein
MNPFLSIGGIVEYGLWFTVDRHDEEDGLLSINDVTE